jgi:serine phosphatase RsbU (regulator of sigma subunit)
MAREPSSDEQELRRLRAEASERQREMRALHQREERQDALIAQLRSEVGVREDHLAELTQQLASTEHELEDLRAIRDALTPPELPQRPGVDLAAAFLPASERVSGDFYLVAEAPHDATVLIVGDVVGHGLTAARRAAFTRTVFAAIAPYSYDPCRLLGWANAALIERGNPTSEYVTAACVTYMPREHRLRWAYAGHPPALWLDDLRQLTAPHQGTPLGLSPNPGWLEGSERSAPSAGMLLYTDGLTDARRGKQFFGLDGVTTALEGLERPTPAEAVQTLRARVADFARDALADDLCLLAARFS